MSTRNTTSDEQEESDSGERGWESDREGHLADEAVQLIESAESIKTKTASDAQNASLALHGLFETITNLELSPGQTPDSLRASVLSVLDCRCLNRPASFLGERSTLLGFDKNSGVAVISRSDITGDGRTRDLKEVNGQVTDDQGTRYQEIDLGATKLYQDSDGALFVRTRGSDGKECLSEIPSLRCLSPNDQRLSIQPVQESAITSTDKSVVAPSAELRPLGATETLAEFSDRVKDSGELDIATKPAAEAIAQSNDYAQRHVLSERIQDGFRTAGQLREFAPDGSFSATDRAATVVDRNRDEKLREIIDDAKKQFADLPPRERAKALAEYVNKIMGPADGDEKALDERYRKLMADNAGKEMLLSDFAGNGSCTQRALLLKLLADEMGLDSSIVRGNGGAHVWNTFRFDGKEEIYDTRGHLYGAESSPLHRPLQDSNRAGADDFVAGQRVISEGKDWTVQGYNSVDGSVILKRTEESTVSEADLKRLNPGKEPQIGDSFKLKSPGGQLEDWVLQSRNSDGSLKMIRVEEKQVARAELSRSVLELAGSKNTDLKYLEDNWKSLVEDNKKLSPEQRAALQAARETLDKTGNAKAGDFRALVVEISRLGTAGGADAQVRIDALTKIAKTLGNHPKGIFPPIETLIKATNADALKQVAESLAQSAPHQENAPLGADGTPERGGKGYEHAAAQALQRALQDRTAVQKMIADKKLPPGEWVFVPGGAGSALDNLKIDGMLVDLSTGKAIFIDFAMHEPGVPAADGGPYRTLEDKLDPRKSWRDGRPKYPFALTLDQASIGWDKPNGGSGRPVQAEAILARLGSYLKGEQATSLGLTGSQDKPHVYDLAALRKALGGEMVNFGPVLNDTEAAVRSEETGKPVTTVDKETAEIGRKLWNHPDDSLRHLGLAADSASKPAAEKVAGSKFLNQSLRAAVELDMVKARDALYGAGKVPDVLMKVETDNVQHQANGRKNPYFGRKYFSLQGDDVGAGTPTEVRIYENGDVFVRTTKADGKMSRDSQHIGNVRDLKGDLAREIQKLGLEPAKQKALIDAFGDIGKNFSKLAKDIEAVQKGTMSAEDFWTKNPELRLLADGVENGDGASKAAQEARPLYDAKRAVEKDPSLRGLDDATKESIAKKFLELVDDGLVKRNKFSMKEAHTVLELEKIKMSTEDAIEAASLKRALRKDAEAWTPAELKSKFEAAKAAQANALRGVTDLAEVHRILDVQAQLKVDVPTAQALSALRNKLLPEATMADLKAINQMHADLKAAGLAAVTVQDAGKIFAKAGILGAAEIAEMARIKAGLPTLKAEDLAQHAVRNLQVENLYNGDKGKADSIRAKAGELAKAGLPLENVHDAAALMVLNNTNQAAALELAKIIAEVRQQRHFPTFAELASTATVLESVRKAAGTPEIRADLEKLVVEGIKRSGNDLDKLKKFLEEELFNRSTEGEHAKHWEKVYNAVDRCKNAAEVAKLLGLPADAAGQKTALDGFEKLFKPEIPVAAPPAAAVTPITLSEIDKKGLDVGKQLKAELAGLQLTTHAQVSEFLKSCLEQIESLKGDKKWSETDRQTFEKLVEKYKQGDAGAMAAINTYLDLRVAAPAPSTTIKPGESDKPAAPAETVTMAELERRMQDPLKRAEVLKKIEEEGPIRETLKKAGISEKRAGELEKDLLSDKEEVREKAKKEIARYYESRGRGGFRGFTKEACGRLGALVMVAAVVLPFLLMSSEDSSGGPSATWSGGKGN